LKTYFAMARGAQGGEADHRYLVPEFTVDAPKAEAIGRPWFQE
jgi:hypothetical protein